MVSTPSSPSNRRFKSIALTGSCEARSAASRIRFASGGLSMRQFYVNRAETRRLRDLDEKLTRELEQEGVQSFWASYVELLGCIESKVAAWVSARSPSSASAPDVRGDA